MAERESEERRLYKARQGRTGLREMKRSEWSRGERGEAGDVIERGREGRWWLRRKWKIPRVLGVTG